jgi:hypothetical protein
MVLMALMALMALMVLMASSPLLVGQDSGRSPAAAGSVMAYKWLTVGGVGAAAANTALATAAANTALATELTRDGLGPAGRT